MQSLPCLVRRLRESIYRAFHLDLPFAPHNDNANRLLSMRDGNGSIDRCPVPISGEDAELEAELLRSRDSRGDKLQTGPAASRWISGPP